MRIDDVAAADVPPPPAVVAVPTVDAVELAVGDSPAWSAPGAPPAPVGVLARCGDEVEPRAWPDG
jgi:hypothetical protein